jgi:DNA-directed RNA polymerase subunit M/transcription elongation factor TFIIS
MTLKSIDQYNQERGGWARLEEEAKAKPSGIACPECGAEMLMDMQMMFASHPPQRLVVCQGCKHQDYVLA